MASESTLIIGLGVFGVSTALRLLDVTCENLSNLTILSHHQPQAPSDDISKIIRIDYPNEERMKESIHAQEAWKNDQRLREFYQPIGRIVAFDKSRLENLDQINQTRATLGMDQRQYLDKSILTKMFGATETLGALTFVYNEDDAVVEWEGCMKSLRDSIKEHLRNAPDSSLLECCARCLIHDERRINAVALSNGDVIDTKQTQVILTVGPWLSKLLADSDIQGPPNSKEPVATGVFAFVLQLTDDQARSFHGKPCFSHIGYAEFLPPTKKDGRAKITCIAPFTNMQSTLGRSNPIDLSDSHLAIQMMFRITRWAREYLPELRGAKVVQIKSYWDGMTQTQDPIIARHPLYNNLVIAGGGSYNRAKDLPTLGESIVNALHRQPLDPRYGWSSNDQLSHQNQPALLASADFHDLERNAKEDVDVKEWFRKRYDGKRLGYLEEI